MPSSENAPQEQLLAILSEHIVSGQVTASTEDAEYYTKELIQGFSPYFPYEGASIYQDGNPNPDPYFPYFEFARKFFEQVVKEVGLNETDFLVVVGDNAMDVALSLPLELVRRYLDDLLNMPQHAYIVPRDVAWCLCYRMEGDMGFGFNTTKNHG